MTITLALVILVGCDESGTDFDVDQMDARGSPSSYLYVWARDSDVGDGDTDFLATVDANPSSQRYGSVLSTAPVGSTGTGAHHAEPVAPATGLLFANGFSSNRTFLFDISTRAAPVLVAELHEVPGLSYPHDFRRLPDGDVLVTMQRGNGTIEGDPGGLALFDSKGELIRTSSAADTAFPGAKIRPYSLEILQDMDRVLTTGRAMSFWKERAADVVQIWRLSDLALLKTFPVPRLEPAALPECTLGPGDLCSAEQYAGESQPFEIRALADGSALLNTFTCGFYRIHDIETDVPVIEPILNWPEALGCSVPAMIGRFAIMPVMFNHAIVTLDVSDTAAPREVSRYITSDGFLPHWTAVDPDSNRIVVTADGPGAVATVMILEVDLATGELSLDERFGAFEDSTPGISFDRVHWPHGSTGAAMPHAALFGK